MCFNDLQKNSGDVGGHFKFATFESGAVCSFGIRKVHWRDAAGFGFVDHSEPLGRCRLCRNTGTDQRDVSTLLNLHSLRVSTWDEDPAWNRKQTHRDWLLHEAAKTAKSLFQKTTLIVQNIPSHWDCRAELLARPASSSCLPPCLSQCAYITDRATMDGSGCGITVDSANQPSSRYGALSDRAADCVGRKAKDAHDCDLFHYGEHRKGWWTVDGWLVGNRW